MIVLKHLAREFNIDPFKLRRMLRDKYGDAKGRRWRWEDSDKELVRIRSYLKTVIPSKSS
jgi:hypothetical protein